MAREQTLFSIGEVAKAIGITRRIILHYEELKLIQPDVKDGLRGNRYYTIDTFMKIRTIRIYQNLGLSLSEIREYLNGSIDLSMMIRRLEALRDELNSHIEKLKERSKDNSNQVEVFVCPQQTVYRRIYNGIDSIAERTNVLRDTALEAMKLFGTDTTKLMYLMESPLNGYDEVSFCVSVAPDSQGEYIHTFPETRALSLYHRGAYEDMGLTVNKLIDYAKKHNYKLKGTVRRIYIEGPPQHKDKSKFLTIILLPIEEE